MAFFRCLIGRSYLTYFQYYTSGSIELHFCPLLDYAITRQFSWKYLNLEFQIKVIVYLILLDNILVILYRYNCNLSGFPKFMFVFLNAGRCLIVKR
jgi:hypothetical protein